MAQVLRANCFESLFSCTKPWRKLLLSSYCTDFDWLLTQLPTYEHELILIQHGSTPGIQKGRVEGRKVTLLTPPFPQFPRYGVMHCKLMLMFGEDLLRIVVSSGNLVPFDYGEVANILFMHDLPKLKGASASSVNSLLTSQFYRSLSSLLDHLGCFRHPGVVLDTRELEAYDWRVLDPRIKMVYSVPGYYDVVGSGQHGGGLLMLDEAVKDLKLDISTTKASADVGVGTGGGPHIAIEYQGSSLGALSREWLDDFERAATGQLQPAATKKRSFHAASANGSNGSLQSTFKIVFPSQRTVEQSLPGPAGFGTIFSKSKDFRSPACPREFFHDCRSGPDRITQCAMHSKTMTVSLIQAGTSSNAQTQAEEEEKLKESEGKLKEEEDVVVLLDSDNEAKDVKVSETQTAQAATQAAQTTQATQTETQTETQTTQAETKRTHLETPLYRYLGSHNFTAAAWGKFVKDGSKLMINNYEVGVLLPEELIGGDKFPYTYHRPPERYTLDDAPWDQSAFFQE